MWLIDTRILELKFVAEVEERSYAILSHTWEDEEFSFQEFRSLDREDLDRNRSKKGFGKIAKTCELAYQRGLSYAWVDTCCIDRSSSAELSEAINSMYSYYQNAAFCIAFISDLEPSLDPEVHFQHHFPNCRWLTRGWTLQELIASPMLAFFDASWTFRGTKSDWKALIAKETGVDEAILEDPQGLPSIPIARRMSWASRRKTTRLEDMAYCLLGIFDINMPLIYGEGRKAFTRLQEEIAKGSCDLSLFAWRQEGSSPAYRGILAESPAEFAGSGGLKHRIRNAFLTNEFAITNKGLRIQTALVNVPNVSEDLVWNLGFSYRDDWPSHTSNGWIGLYLAKTPGTFVRARPDEFFQADWQPRYRCISSLMHIRKALTLSDAHFVGQRFQRALKIEPSSMAKSSSGLAPKALWDENRALFLNQGHGINAYLRLAFPVPGFHEHRLLIVACSTMDTPFCVIFQQTDPMWPQIHSFLETSHEMSDFVAVDYLRLSFSVQEWPTLSSKASTCIQGTASLDYFNVSAELKERTYGDRSMFVLNIEVS
ncbi:heterokaryon incompatibility protein-domain-containing protein [Xylariaceae sp. FL1651]|nr:heterokaryon incompatibility protein-domain-containing protein [Xylariaceae sp. FL1651]